MLHLEHVKFKKIKSLMILLSMKESLSLLLHAMEKSRIKKDPRAQKNSAFLLHNQN